MTVNVNVRLKAEGVSLPVGSDNGIKVMIYTNNPQTGSGYFNPPRNVTGTFDWSITKFQYFARIHPNITTLTLYIGMQEVYGTIWVDEVNITVWRPTPPKNPPPIYKGHPNIPRLRGVMSPQKFNESDIQNVAVNWRANIMRWQIFNAPASASINLTTYDAWLQPKLNETDQVLAACLKYLHALPPGNDDCGTPLLCDHTTQTYFLNLWKKMALRYKGHPAVYGYDIANEPILKYPVTDSLALTWQALAEATVKAIRTVDTNVNIIVESAQQANPAQFDWLVPINDSKVIYEMHMYDPSDVTFQGISPFPYPGPSYPGTGAYGAYNINKLRSYLLPARTFSLAFNVPIYVGEFSCVRWAVRDSARQYMADLISLFEEYDWDWTYHAYREFEGWSVEYDEVMTNKVPVTYNTTRKLLLLNAFSTNIKPTIPTTTTTTTKSTTTAASTTTKSATRNLQ